MNLGIDISQIVYQGTGVARFTTGLVDAIMRYDKTNHWTFFFSGFRQKLSTELEQQIYQAGHTLIKWSLPPTVLSYLWNDFHNYSAFNFFGSSKLDWFITSDWTEPKVNSRKATIVHDLVFMRYPETVDKKIISTQQKRLQWVQQESDLIFADSEATKQDLIDLQKIGQEKVKVIYPGVNIAPAANYEVTAEKYNITKPYILTVGKIEPRKNIKKLIQAFHQIKDDVQLVIVGPKGWDSIEAIDDPRIRYLGFVTDTELSALYQNALFFILPSIWEGFGYPVVEAMKLGCPVAISNTSSLMELGEHVALFFDPHSKDSIQDALTTLIHNENLRNEIKQKGLETSTQFTWENYYNQFIITLTSS